MDQKEPSKNDRPENKPKKQKDWIPPVGGYRKISKYNSPTIYENWPPVNQPYKNDCQIIVFLKPQARYAEYIEYRVKILGLIVDLLFPKMHISVTSILANISTKGCLYAILIRPENEEYKTLTLYILHGIPQEHKNVPMESALAILRSNFYSYVQRNKLNESVRSTPYRNPKKIQLIPNLLTNSRQFLTVQGKYDLQNRRECEVSETVEQDSQEPGTKEAEQQSPIVNFLNEAATDLQPPSS